MSSKLANMYRVFSEELAEIERVFLDLENTPHVAGFSIPYRPVEDGCLVSIWDAWNRFIRSLLLASCAGPVEGISGTVYTPQIPMTESQATQHLALLSRRRGNRITAARGEPYWFNVSALPDMTSALGLANATVIDSAVTASSISLDGGISMPSPLAEIRDIRNFVAHKNEGTLAQAQSHMRYPVVDCSAHMRQKTIGGLYRFSNWVDCLAALAESATF